MKNVLVFDIGGTWIRGGFFVKKKLLIKRQERVSAKFANSRNRMFEMATMMAKGKRIDRVVLGLPGVLNEAHTTMVASKHLPAWQNKAITHEVRHYFRAPTLLFNDATLGALGEAQFGAGADYLNVGYIAIGTGIGGTCVVNGTPIGRTNLEPGHHFMEQGRTWEDLIGGRSLQRRFGRDWKNWKRSQWNWVEHQLGVGLVNLIRLWSPDVIVLGGSVMRNTHIRLTAVKQLTRHVLPISVKIPRIVRASLKDEAGLFGGLVVSYPQTKKL